MRIWRTLGLAAILPLVSGALLLGASVVDDSHRIPRELAAWKLQTGVMLCTEGTIQRGDGSWLDRILDAGTFRCGGWNMRGQRPGPAGLVEWPSSPRR
jgi:hypothetical protein